MSHGFQRVAVIGTGLMGGSLALALRKAHSVESVAAYDISDDTRDKAREMQIADFVADSPEEAVGGCDLAFIATPIGAMIEALQAGRGSLEDGTVVSDLGSAKLGITERMQEVVPDGVHYVGGHPMTGSELSGIEFAREDLYRDCYYILTPTESTDPDSFSRLHALLSDIGARVLSMDPRSHDMAMAVVSHVPHLLSLLLMDQTRRKRRSMRNLYTIAAGGFRDMTRIAASNPDIWIDICLENNRFIIDELLSYGVAMTELVDALESQDRARLTELFNQARQARSELSVKEGLEVRELFQVSMPVPDEPGVISRVSTAVGNLGTNIEDIEIVHPLEGDTGILTLKVLGETKAREVRSELESMGYRASVHKG